MVVFGVGMGMTLQIVVVAVQNAVERRDIGSSTSAVSFFRNIGAACGTALLGTVLVSRLGFWLPRLVPAHSGLNLSQAFTITPKQLRALPPTVRAGVVDSFVRSLHVVFMVGIPLAGLALVCAILLKDQPLNDSVSREEGSREEGSREEGSREEGSREAGSREGGSTAQGSGEQGSGADLGAEAGTARGSALEPATGG